jgi:hypothetical protein
VPSSHPLNINFICRKKEYKFHILGFLAEVGGFLDKEEQLQKIS